MSDRSHFARGSRVTLAVIVAICCSAGVAAADGRDPVLARQLLKEGYELARAGRCEDAIKLFQSSQDLDPQPKTLLNLARCEEDRGRFGAALGHWAEARELARERHLGAMVAEAEVRIVSLESKMPTLVVRLREGSPAATRIVRDGRLLPPETLGRTLPVDPGNHTLEISAEGHASNSLTVHIAATEAKIVEVAPGNLLMPSEAIVAPTVVAESRSELTDHPSALLASEGLDTSPSRASITRPFFYGGLGVAALGVIVGSATGIVALSQAPELKAQCTSGECPGPVYDRVESVRTSATVSTIAFGAAAVGAVTAGVAFLLTPKSSEASALKAKSPTKTSPTVAISPWALPGSAGALTTLTY